MPPSYMVDTMNNGPAYALRDAAIQDRTAYQGGLGFRDSFLSQLPSEFRYFFQENPQLMLNQRQNYGQKLVDLYNHGRAVMKGKIQSVKEKLTLPDRINLELQNNHA